MLENLFELGQVATSNVEKTLEKQLRIDADSLTSNLDSRFLMLMVTASSFFLKLTADTGWPFTDWRIRCPVSLALSTLADVSNVWPVGCLLSK